MNSAGTILCALPPTCFGGKISNELAIELLRGYISALRAIERRIRKGVAINEEGARYARLCRQIEEVALSRAVPAAKDDDFRAALSRGDFPSIRIASGYADLLSRFHAAGMAIGVRHEVRLGATVFAPDEIQKHVAFFRTWTAKPEWEHDLAIRDRIWFITKRIMPQGCGLVEFADALGMSMEDELKASETAMDVRTVWDRIAAWIRRLGTNAAPAPPTRAAPRSTTWVPADSLDWKQYQAAPRGEYMHGRLRKQIEQALEGGPPIDLGNQRHNLLVEELVRYLHKSTRPPSVAAMMYENGQPTRPFPLRCVERLPDGWTPTRILHVGLISMRHLPVDQYIDINWYRNTEVPSQEGLSGADEACYHVSVAQLDRLTRLYAGQRLRLFVYHSGFLPAVVAFYRALVNRLSSRQHKAGSLQVHPMLQPGKDGTYEIGQAWPG